jgi:hypothetical protein
MRFFMRRILAGRSHDTAVHLEDRVKRDRGYLEPTLYSRLMNLARAATKVTTRLLQQKQRQPPTIRRRRGDRTQR